MSNEHLCHFWLHMSIFMDVSCPVKRNYMLSFFQVQSAFLPASGLFARSTVWSRLTEEHFARGRALMPHQIFLSHLFSSYFSPAPEQIFLTFLKSDFLWSTDLVTQASISSWGTFLLFHKLPCDSEVKNRRGRGCHHVSRLYETRSDCNKYLWMSCKLWIIGLFIRFCLSQQQKNCIENKKTVWTCFKAAWPVVGSYERYNSSRFV